MSCNVLKLPDVDLSHLCAGGYVYTSRLSGAAEADRNDESSFFLRTLTTRLGVGVHLVGSWRGVSDLASSKSNQVCVHHGSIGNRGRLITQASVLW